MAGRVRLDQVVRDRAVQGDAGTVAAEVDRVIHLRVLVDAARVPTGPLPPDIAGAVRCFEARLPGGDPDDPAVLVVDDLVKDPAGLIDVQPVRAPGGRP